MNLLCLFWEMLEVKILVIAILRRLKACKEFILLIFLIMMKLKKLNKGEKELIQKEK